jgi:SAM-dependent methyltransferase
MRVLDVGCGTGDDVRAIAALVGEAGAATGIDSSQAMIDEAHRRGVPVNASFLRCSATQMPFTDASFDAARAERVFQHLADPSAAAAELRRVVKPGGSVFLLDQDWESLSIAGADPAVTRIITRAFTDRVANGSAGAQARGLLRRAGFAHVELVPMIAAPALPVAFELIFKSAVDAALAAGAIDAATGARWLSDLLQAEAAGGFYCAVIVIAALGR